MGQGGRPPRHFDFQAAHQLARTRAGLQGEKVYGREVWRENPVLEDPVGFHFPLAVACPPYLVRRSRYWKMKRWGSAQALVHLDHFVFGLLDDRLLKVGNDLVPAVPHSFDFTLSRWCLAIRASSFPSKSLSVFRTTACRTEPVLRERRYVVEESESAGEINFPSFPALPMSESERCESRFAVIGSGYRAGAQGLMGTGAVAVTQVIRRAVQSLFWAGPGL
jgi:hypothetical protein